jgi:hypothetical protein
MSFHHLLPEKVPNDLHAHRPLSSREWEWLSSKHLSFPPPRVHLDSCLTLGQCRFACE